MVKFNECLFYKKFQIEIVNIARKKIDVELNNSSIQYSSSEQYFLEFLWLLAEVQYKLNDLELCLSFLNFFPPNKSLRSKISRYNYIVYHLEFYYINIIALFDRFLHIIKFIFSLKLYGANITLPNIEKTGLVSDDIVTFMKVFDQNISKIRSTQNIIKHRLKFQERELDDVELFEHIIKNSSGMNIDSKDQVMYKFASKLKYSFYLKNKKKEIKSNNKFFEEMAVKLCDSTLPYFDANYNQRKNSNRPTDVKKIKMP